MKILFCGVWWRMKSKLFKIGVLILVLASMLPVDVQLVKPQQTSQTNLVVLEFDFPPVIVTKGYIYDSVMMLGLPQYGAPGEPVLPFRITKVLIPRGRDVQGVDVTANNKKVLEGNFNVEYGKTPIPISSNIAVGDQPNQTIYGSTNPFPGVLFSVMTEQQLRGFKILILRLYPVQYVPKAGVLSYFEKMTVTVNTIVSDSVSSLFRDLQQDRDLVLDIVDNPSEVESYTETEKSVQSASLVGPSDLCDYVVITNNALKPSFQQLIDWKIQKGLNATIVLVEDIINDPAYHCNGLFGDGCGTQFNDTQAHVRNFIKDAYINWGTEYVLLGGDDEILPARGVYAYVSGYYLGSGHTDYNIPCDMYYGALDGSWDNDNDTIFGEGVCHQACEEPENGTAGEEADFFAEVYIGRATVDTPQEATNFVSKTLAYEQNSNTSYLKKALMIGQTLDDQTEGGNGKDLVTDVIPQYTTTRLYGRDGTFSRSAVIDEMNSGTHIVNDDGHANYGTVMGLSRSDVDSLTNTEYFMAYSIGCYSAAFDSATSGTSEAIGEHFVTSNGGAFAYIGNSRYGLYLPGSNEGPGDRYDRSFFEVLNNGTRNLGKALQLSKENLFDEFVDRWTYFNLNLLGDPETEIVTDITAPTAHFETRTDLLAPPRYGKPVSLRGTAKRGTAANSTFSNYTIEFGVGINPAFWSSTGVDLTNNGESEVINGTLGVWNISLVDDGTYTLRLTVNDADGTVGEDWIVIICTPIIVPEDYLTIQEAINHAHNEDIIYVKAGTYYENLVVNKSVSLLGESRENTVIDGGGYDVVSMEADGAVLKEFTIRNGHCGINLLACLNNSISENCITNNTFGIRLYESSNNTICHNNFIDNTQQVNIEISGYANFLDDGYPSGGNYWSDFKERYPDVKDVKRGSYQNETGSDGIWDHPYEIDENNQDNYPRIQKGLWGDVNSDGIVNLADAAKLNLIFSGWILGPPYIDPTTGKYLMPDINGDGIVNLVDVAKLDLIYSGYL